MQLARSLFLSLSENLLQLRRDRPTDRPRAASERFSHMHSIRTWTDAVPTAQVAQLANVG